MKKLLVIVMALSMSACVPPMGAILDFFGFEPIPTPLEGQPYVLQALDVDGNPLCGMTESSDFPVFGVPYTSSTSTDYSGWPQGWLNEIDATWGNPVNDPGNLSGFDRVLGDDGLYPRVYLPFGEGEKVQVFIASNIPNWTLYDISMDHSAGTLGNLNTLSSAFPTPLAVTWAEFEKTGPGEMVCSEGGVDLFKVTWPEKVINFLGIPALEWTWPTFSGTVTIERIDPYFSGLITFLVKGDNMWGHGNVYTAFMVEFQDFKSGANLIAEDYKPFFEADQLVITPSGPPYFTTTLPDKWDNDSWNNFFLTGIFGLNAPDAPVIDHVITGVDVVWSLTDGIVQDASIGVLDVYFAPADALYLTATVTITDNGVKTDYLYNYKYTFSAAEKTLMGM